MGRVDSAGRAEPSAPCPVSPPGAPSRMLFAMVRRWTWAAALLLVACHGKPHPSKPAATTPTATVEPSQAPSPAPPPSPKPAASFGFDRVAEACGSFSAHLTNADQTSYLDLFVDVKALGLDAGEHEVALGRAHAELTITQLAEPHRGEWSCTDIGGGPRSEVVGRWKATGGKLRVHLYEPTPPAKVYEGRFDRVDIELIDVQVTDETGQSRTLDLKFDGLGIGWLPG